MDLPYSISVICLFLVSFRFVTFRPSFLAAKMLFIRTGFFEAPSSRIKDNEETMAVQWIINTLVVYLTVAFTLSAFYLCIRPQQYHHNSFSLSSALQEQRALHRRSSKKSFTTQKSNSCAIQWHEIVTQTDRLVRI